MMVPLIPTMVLAFLSFMSSAFVILRIVVPILPPHPLSRRVAPAEFGLPNFRSLSPADKSHIWLASFDMLALALFIWQAINEYVGGPTNFAVASDPASAVRLWIALTIRQTCLFIVASITLLHVRLGRSVTFGTKHWMLWTPTALLIVVSTTFAGVISGAGLSTLFIGLVAYMSSIAMLSSLAFACLVGTLIIIKRNLTALNEISDPWPPVKQMEEKPRPSFATEEIDALRDGASWITSNASSHVSSRRNSISAWSFSTHHTNAPSSHHDHIRSHPASGSHPSLLPKSSVPAKSSFWFNPATPYDGDVPPVPPLPSTYGPLSPTAEGLSDPDPFRRDIPTPIPDLPEHPRQRFGSQTSWLTSTNGSQTTLSAWSYPTIHHEGNHPSRSSQNLHDQLLLSTTMSRPATPAMASARVLGGYGYAPRAQEVEKGLAALAAPTGSEIDVSVYRAIGWLVTIWVPLGFALPYLFSISPNAPTSTTASILLVLSITLSSPLLALNILFRSPIPIPSGLFDIHTDAPSNVLRGPSPASSSRWSHGFKQSNGTSVTVVEGRRSGDVWIANGDAIDGKSKISRAMGILTPRPKLSVLPPEGPEDGEVTPPLPIQAEESSLPLTVHSTPHSETSVDLGRIRKESRASSQFLGGDESLAYSSKILIAQRHYSALAQTVIVSASPEKNTGLVLDFNAATSSIAARRADSSAHLRSRSVSYMSGQTPTSGSSGLTPPPSFPLPPTPPNVRTARLAQLKHKKSFSSGFSFGAVDDLNEIDTLTAGVLPLLVPGLKIGAGMRIKEGAWPPVSTYGKSSGIKTVKTKEFGGLAREADDFSSPEIHSTPARRRPREPRGRKSSQHKRNHFSLPSLSLGKDGIHSLATWSAEIRDALETEVGLYTKTPANVEVNRRNTVWGGESIPTTRPHLGVVKEEDVRPTFDAQLSRAMSTRSLGLRAEVPHGVDTNRSSIATINMIPTSAASTATLFEFEDGLESGPQAESTPHNTVIRKNVAVPPLPLPEHVTSSALPSPNRRSSIVYIKSDDPVSSTTPSTIPMTTSTISSLAQWSSRAVRPLIPKVGKSQRNMSNTSSSPTGTKPGSPGGGLRPLTLLQERNPNTSTNSATSGSVDTRPLVLGKKQRSRPALSLRDENANPDSSFKNENMKPLQLTRSETSKMRGKLRKGETLPDVVVRPPSASEHIGYAYSFSD